jgi:uncharacterized membrane protein YebE (DUF533 family)
MFNAKNLLDAVVAGVSSPRPGQPPSRSQQNFLETALEAYAAADRSLLGKLLRQATGGLRDMAEEARRHAGGATEPADADGRSRADSANFDDLKRKAKEIIGRNPELAQGALLGAAGLLLGTSRGRAIAANLAGLGGLALITGLVYRAFQNYQAGRPILELGPTATNEDALVFIRAMVAATAADRHLDESERRRLTTALTRVGIEAEAAQWLEREFARPATIEELAALSATPEKAAQVYAAARLAIEPDTTQEREFLRKLADALKLDPAVKSEIDEGASDIKVDTARPASVPPSSRRAAGQG